MVLEDLIFHLEQVVLMVQVDLEEQDQELEGQEVLIFHQVQGVLTVLVDHRDLMVPLVVDQEQVAQEVPTFHQELEVPTV